MCLEALSFLHVMIVLKNVRKNYGSTTIIHDLSLEVAKGETLVLLGSSGCGKTTTLKMINRLISFNDGDILIRGESIMYTDPIALRRSIGYVFQNIGLLPHFTVKENLYIVPKLLKWDKEKTEQQLEKVCDTMHIERSFLKRRPKQLSGGQRQRVGVGRALMGNPDIVLMDEPFGALDPITRESIQDEFSSLKAYINKTIVFVTHDIHEAFTIADRICVMEQGAIEQIGTKREILEQPASEFVERFVHRHRKALAKELE